MRTKNFSKPKVKLENYKEIYSYYGNTAPNGQVCKAGQYIMRSLIRPNISYLGDAEDQISEHFDNKGVMILSANHTRFIDPLVMAATVGKADALSAMRRDTLIPTKAALFKPGIRWAIEGMGSIPVFRQKDITHLRRDSSPEERTDLSRASNRLINVLIAQIEAGKNLAIFPEGTRYPREPEVVHDLDRGIGVLIYKALSRSKTNLAILPMGINYGEQHISHPSVVLGSPLQDNFTSVSHVLDTLKPAMQSCLDQAIQYNNEANG